MSFSLTPVPLGIGTSDVMLLKTDKAKGICYFLNIKLSPKKPDKNVTLVIEDRNTSFYALIKDMPCNVKEINLKLFGIVSLKNCDTIFSTDMYCPDFLKFMKTCRRGSADKLIIKGVTQKPLKRWNEKHG